MAVKGDGNAGEELAAIVMDARRLPVHRLARAHDLGAVRGADGLVAEADAEDGGVGPSSRMRSTEMPASFGEQGPGETMMCEGARARISSMEMASLRTTTGCSPSSRT